MNPAARVTDTTAMGAVITGPGVSTVLIGNMPAAVVGDMHSGVPAANIPPAPIPAGSTKVMIGNKPAVRMLDNTSAGPIIKGEPKVLIG